MVVLAGALAACRPTQSTRDVMWTHFERVGEMESAVIDGDVARAKNVAAVIAGSDSIPGLSANAKPYEAALKDQARIGETAPDLASAARSVAGMGKSCGDCHRALGRGPVFVRTAEPLVTDQPMTGAMLRHRWAVDQMWDGLIGPSDSAWYRGAAAMQEEGTYLELIRPNVPRGDAMRAMAQSLRAMGTRAQAEADAGQRAILYGRMLTTCVACHELAFAK
jgi:mono/diheme cytochrome c family protein